MTSSVTNIAFGTGASTGNDAIHADRLALAWPPPSPTTIP